MNLNLRDLPRQLQRRFQSRAALAVQLHSNAVNVSLIREEEDVIRVLHSFTLPMSADVFAGDPERAGAELAAQLRTLGIRERRCVVCVPPGWALSASTEIPEIEGGDLRAYLELRAEREFPINVSELRLAHCSYTLPDGKRRATIAAVAARRLAGIEQTLEKAGCKLVSLSLGLDRFLLENTAAPTMHFLANGTHIDVVVTAGGGIAALRSLAGSVAQDESIFDSSGFCREVRITLGGLPDAVRQQVREAHFGGPAKTAEALCLRTRDDLRRLGVDPAAIDRGAEEEGPALEAATHFLQSQPVAFEFLPPRVSRWETAFEHFDSGRRRAVIAAVVGLVILPIVAFIIHSHIRSNLQGEWDGMKRNVSELEGLQQNLRTFRGWFDPVPETLMLLEGLISAFPESGDVWAKSVQITEGQKITCTGFARNHGAITALLERFRKRPEVADVQLKQERGESPNIQFSITFKWDPNHGK